MHWNMENEENIQNMQDMEWVEWSSGKHMQVLFAQRIDEKNSIHQKSSGRDCNECKKSTARGFDCLMEYGLSRGGQFCYFKEFFFKIYGFKKINWVISKKHSKIF